MKVDLSDWHLHHEKTTEITFEEYMAFLVADWERYQAMKDGEHNANDVALAKLELESLFYLTLRKFPIGDCKALLDGEITLDKIMNKLGAEDYEQLEKKVNKLILKNKIIEEAE